MTDQPITEADILKADRKRRLFWGIVVIWAVAAWFIGQALAERMRFRINDLSVIPGAGYIMRDQDGTFYHVNTEFKSRAIFPNLEPPVYQTDCVDCALVTGEQMSTTNEFCASARLDELPNLDFELPCKTWAPMGDGQRVIAFVVFIVPLVLYPILRAILDRALSGNKKK